VLPPSRLGLKTLSLASDLASDVVLYNELAVFNEFHVLDKVNKDEVMTGSASCVKFLLQLPDKRQ